MLYAYAQYFFYLIYTEFSPISNKLVIALGFSPEYQDNNVTNLCLCIYVMRKQQGLR